ncbi:hypothetical protein ABB37_07728 [Leptomonas pyrrhocoris]|uniref:Uncharacterized protein n=1 Tax=Leptomonas pyrrhocoris TaxID=157538 RepID=A0A0N0DSP8_LEPPY|nr:hypothetical protein ABB37_07728 [Leptomonas pyrrhocoris]KPA76388.1 hypothetical protein ABB37_07728 [Leptomonas pyrrhocoris]|eukprot:XP_015654827.1 hypothetical protein ABB37_07728 [Leptomonas pyrrhocoris]
MSRINVFVSYADSFVGTRVLSQFQQSPSTYHVYGCTWDSAAADKLNAAAVARLHAAAAARGLRPDAVAADAAGAAAAAHSAPVTSDEAHRSSLHDSRGLLTSCETSRTDTAPLPSDIDRVGIADGPPLTIGGGEEEEAGHSARVSGTTANDAPSLAAAAAAAPASALLTSTFFSRHDVAATRAALLACDWIVVELRQAQTVLEVVQFLQLQSSFERPKRLVLLSSLMTWYATPALTAAEAAGDDADLNDDDAARQEDEEADGDTEAPYPPPPPQSLERILQSAQDAARRAVVDAMRTVGPVESGATGRNGKGGEEEEEEEEGGNEAGGDAAAEVLTEDQYNRRVPHLQYMSWRDAEKAVAAAHHAKGLPLDTFVVCSGLPYGGEEDVLEPLFRLAWSARPEKDDDVAPTAAVTTAASLAATPAATAVLPVFGDGSQRVPLVHAQDLACFVRKLLCCPSANLPFPERRYLFATDGANRNSWMSIVKGVNNMFGGRCALQPVPPPSYPLYRDVDKFTLNLRVEAESMKTLMERQDDREEEEAERERKALGEAAAGAAAPPRLPNTWVAEGSLRRHLRAVAHQFAVARGVSPLRIALVGPPLVGKSYLAARLARYYRLPCVSLDSVVAEYTAALEALRTRVETTKAAVLQAERTRRLGIKRRRVVARQQREWDAGAAARGDADPASAAAAAAGTMMTMSDQEDAADEVSSMDNEGGRGTATAGGVQREVAAATFALTAAEDEDVTRVVQEWWAEQPLAQAWRSKIGEMERVLLLRLHPRPPTPDANPKRRAAGGNSGGGAKKKGNAVKDAQKSKEEEEELLQLKASLQNAPFQTRALALMLRWRLAQPDCRVHGFVLDGVPTTLEMARLVFADNDADEAVQPPATEEEALRPRYAGEGAASAAAAAAGGATDGEETGMGGAGMAGPAAAKEPASEARLPDHVVVLQASDTYLLSRLRAVGVAAEQQQRKLDTTAPARHAVDVEAFQNDLQTYKQEYVEATYSVLSYLECAGATINVEGVPKTERRAEVHLVTVEGHEPLVPPPPPASVFAETPLGDTEQLLQQVIVGPPHNFGKSLEELQRDAVRQRCLEEEEEKAYAAQVAAKVAAESAECAMEQSARNADDAKMAELRRADLAELELRKQPMTRYLQERVLPLLHKGLLEVCATRPDDPVDFLAEWIMRHNPHDDTFCDI